MKLPKLYFYHNVHFRKWHARTPDEIGIGMSEVQNIQCAERLAKRGYDVTCYAPLPEEINEETYNGVTWKKCELVDWTQKGVWFLYRDPALFDNFNEQHEGQLLISISQDEYYHFNDEQIKKLDYLFCFCEDHAKQYTYQRPELKDKIRITSNGLRVDLIRELEKGEIPERNPYRITYASSPDRGLLSLIDIYKRAKEFIPKLELHIGYSFYNIDRLIEKGPQYAHFKKQKDEILAALEGVKDVHWMSGDSSMPITQPQLYKEWMKTGFFVYCTNFRETSCATLMEAQALGAVPLVSPVWALRSNTLSGIAIDGDANDPLTKCTFAAELVKLCRIDPFREQLRADAMKLARDRFNWERIVDGWEMIILGLADKIDFAHAQFCFQNKWAEGKIMNLGSHRDASGFRKHRGAVNVDIQPLDIVDVVADAKTLPEELFGKFDTVIVGDILEHQSKENAVKILLNAKQCLVEGGKIIVTAPDDNRPHSEQEIGEHEGPRDPREYGDEASPFHNGCTRKHLESVIREAELKVEIWQPLDYGFALGNAFVCAV